MTDGKGGSKKVIAATTEASPLTLPASMLAENWCCTDVEKHTATFYWTLKHFPDYVYKNGERVQSSKFTSSDGKLEWRVDLYPRGVRANYEDCVSLFLHSSRRCIGSDTLNADMTFCLMNSERQDIKKVSYKACQFEAGKSVGCPVVMTYNSLVGNLKKDGTLLIHCEVNAIKEGSARTISYGKMDVMKGGKATLAMDTEEKGKAVEFNQLGTDLGELLLTGDFSDVSIHCDGTIFKAHKNILSARSSFFRGMFAHNFREQQENRVDIIDVAPDVLQIILHFIYTERITSDVKEKAQEVLATADRYDLQGLKDLCEQDLIKLVTLENICETILFAERHNAKKLKSHAIGWMQSCADEVLESDAWNDLLMQDARLASEILLSISKKPRR